MKHGDTALCRRCWEVLTYQTDTARAYWQHPNRYPYCRDVNDPDADPGPGDPVIDEGGDFTCSETVGTGSSSPKATSGDS